MRRFLIAVAVVLVMVGPALAATTVTSTSGAVSEQGQEQGQFGYVNIESPPNYLPIPPIIPVQPVLIPGGITDMTSIMPNIGIKPYAGEEIEAVWVKDGNFLSRIRLEDVMIDLVDFRNEIQKAGWDMTYVRIQVYTRTSSSGFAIGGGAQAGGSALDPIHGTASMASASILPGYARSTADPRFTMIAYRLKK